MGFDKTKVVSPWDDDIIADLTCVICLDIVKIAVTPFGCGHLFCEACLVNKVLKCPTCSLDFTQTAVPSPVVLNLLSKCSTTCDQCSETYPLNDTQLIIKHDHDAATEDGRGGSRARPSTTTAGEEEERVELPPTIELLLPTRRIIEVIQVEFQTPPQQPPSPSPLPSPFQNPLLLRAQQPVDEFQQTISLMSTIMPDVDRAMLSSLLNVGIRSAESGVFSHDIIQSLEPLSQLLFQQRRQQQQENQQNEHNEQHHP